MECVCVPSGGQLGAPVRSCWSHTYQRPGGGWSGHCEDGESVAAARGLGVTESQENLAPALLPPEPALFCF